MLIESPRWTSSRMGPTSVMAAENPFPPEEEVSRGVNEDITPMCSTTISAVSGGGNYTNPSEHKADCRSYT